MLERTKPSVDVWDDGRWGESGAGRETEDLAQGLDGLTAFRATEGFTGNSPLVFGVETVLGPTATKKMGKWYRGILKLAERFMIRWHVDEAKSRQRHACVMDGVQGKQMGGGTHYHAWPSSYDHRPSHPYNAGTEHVGFHRPGRHRLRQTRTAVRCSASLMKSELHLLL